MFYFQVLAEQVVNDKGMTPNAMPSRHVFSGYWALNFAFAKSVFIPRCSSMQAITSGVEPLFVVTPTSTYSANNSWIISSCLLESATCETVEHALYLVCLCSLCCMMTSSNGNIFRVTGPLCGEFTGRRWIPRIKASDAELWCFHWSTPE